VAERVANKVVSIMTGWPTMNGVPLRSDIKVGRAWGSLLKVKNGCVFVDGGTPTIDAWARAQAA